MTQLMQDILEQAKGLRDIEKSALVDMLLTQLDVPDPSIEEAWTTEVARRMKAAADGRMTSLSYDEVMARFPE